MTPSRTRLRLYGAPSGAEPLEWPWVERQLVIAGTYWVVARAHGHPHPRPVWGVWQGEMCHLSVGSPRLVADLRTDPTVTVHLGDGTDVVIVEGVVDAFATAPAALAEYNTKYDWDYRVPEYGDLVAVRPVTVLAWRSAGWAGRDGFREVGRWSFADPSGS